MEAGSRRILSSLLSEYSAVFKARYNKVQLRVKESAKPKFCQARQVPFSLRSAVNDELEILESEAVFKNTLNVSE